MGNPLGPTLANIFLCHHESKWLRDCPIEFKPHLYRRYVDDVFLLFKDRSHVNHFLRYLNSKHPNIKFTSEIEDNGHLNYLDVHLTRDDGKFNSSVYKKKSFTGLGLRFDSFLPSSYKENLIRCLVDRAYKICSDFQRFSEELSNLRGYFSGNHYPQTLFDKQVKIYLDNIYNKAPTVTTVPKNKIFMSMPYLGEHSDCLKRKLHSLVQRFYPQVDMHLIFRSSRTIGSFFQFKDKLPAMLRSQVIYKYQCGQCPSTYIGKTWRQLKVRVSEHKGISFRTGNPIVQSGRTDVFIHATDKDHPVTQDGFTILDYASKFDLKLLESIYIHKQQPDINEREGSQPLFIVK